MLIGVLLACTEEAPVAGAVVPGPPATVSGVAWAFDTDGGPIADAEVGVLEWPGTTTITAADGSFSVEVPSGGPVSLTLSHPAYAPIQTATLDLPAEGLAGLNFQAPDWEMVDLLAAFVNTDLDPDRCQIASTVLRPAGAVYDEPHAEGEPGATVTAAPPIPADEGPVYFNIATYNLIWPDWALDATTEDGGVLFVNVEAGVYTLEAHKEGMSFTPRTVTCRAGWIVNAAPPLGLQAE